MKNESSKIEIKSGGTGSIVAAAIVLIAFGFLMFTGSQSHEPKKQYVEYRR